jgi:pheromone shutdown-related protein TraB
MTPSTTPAATSEMVHRLATDDKEILLVGTAHVSRESTELVTDIIAEEQPDTVCVELCESRYQSIRQTDRWREMDIIKVVKEKKALFLLSNLMLASFQKRIASKFGIQPGAEMLAAIESAETAGARLHLADRDIRTTLSRTWRAMSLWSRIKIMFQFLASLGDVGEISEEEIERMKQEDMLQSVLSEVERSFPAVRRILIDERDRYLAEKIRTAPGRRIVAVVGAGHVPGIKRYFSDPQDLAALETIPPGGRLAKTVKWLLPAAILVLFGYGFIRGGAGTGTDMISWWIAANGILAGLGALIALAHPLTILSAVLAAPLTSLNPMIAAGWVSGLVEAFSRKPKVRDFEDLTEDIQSVRGFWKNKVTKILLVVVLTNIGSAVGTFVALPMIIKLL